MKRWLFVAAIAAVAVAAVVVPPAIVRTAYPDAAAPRGLSMPVSDFGRVLVDQLERAPWAEARFIGAETRERDRLVILLFELRSYPYLLPPELAFLASRCRALAELQPLGMSGGIVIGRDPWLDPELEYLRSDAQPACG